jgi:hypothetical protein
MRFKILSSLVATAALVPALSQADGFSYSYLEGAYVNSDVDNFDKDIDGFAVRGSVELPKNIFLFGNYTDQGTSILGTDVGLQALELGAGYAWPLASNLDLYGKVGYVHAEADLPGPNIDDDGYLLGVGLRGRVAEKFELEGGVKYRDLSDWGDDTTVGLAARYFFTPNFAAGLDGEFGEDANSYGVNVRWNFGK